jgi:hypothetical protein
MTSTTMQTQAPATRFSTNERTDRLLRRAVPLLAIFGGGLALRIVLAFVLFPGQGLASDLGLFESWATTLARVGPGELYATAGSANYPPGFLYVLWLIGSIAGPIATLLGTTSGHAIVLMLKVPAIVADVAIAGLAYRLAGRWLGRRAGLVAAALYLFVPVTWYDSALWGQVDAFGALVMLAALVLLIEGWSEPAAALAAVAMLIKPQDAIALVIVVPVLVRRHLIAREPGSAPRLGSRAATLDRAFGGALSGLIAIPGPIRLGTSAMAAALAGILPLLPFDIARFASASLADVPVVGQVAGLVGLIVSDGGQFAVLSANAFNAWALVGPSPLASIIGGNTGSWTADSFVLFGGLSAATIGAGLLLGTMLMVFIGLLRRDGRVPILLGFSLLAFAFYALPARVHERYLLPFFATGAILATAALWRAATFVGVALLNTINLHAILGAAVSINTGQGGRTGGSGTRIFGPGAGGGGGASGFAGGGDGFGGGATSIRLPLVELARSEAVVTAVAIGQTLAFVGLLVAWLIVAFGPGAGGKQPSATMRRNPLERMPSPGCRGSTRTSVPDRSPRGCPGCNRS